jgi:hypothetical protein
MKQETADTVGVTKVTGGRVADFGVDPYLPKFWKMESNKRGGASRVERNGNLLYLDGKKIQLWISRGQEWGVVEGNILRSKLERKNVVGATMLDFLLNNPDLIPETWKKSQGGNVRRIFFWGTMYINGHGSLCVRCLVWKGDWMEDFLCLKDDFCGKDQAMILAS